MKFKKILPLVLIAIFAIFGSAFAQDGGSITLGMSVEPFTLDPQAGVYIPEQFIIQNIFDPLVFADPTGEIFPGLATEWSSNEEGTEYTLKLRTDVKFHDGTPFNAEAVKFALDRAKVGVGTAAGSPALLTTYVETEVVDDATVIVKFSETNATFIQDLARPWLMIPSPTAVEELGDEFGTKPVGTGPFIFDSWKMQDNITVKKNPDYNVAPSFMAHSGAAYLDEIVFRILPEEASRLNALQTGEAQIVQDPSALDATNLMSDPNFEVYTFSSPGVPSHQMINTEKFPTDDLVVRQAMNYAVDQDAIMMAATFGLTPGAYSIITPTTWAYNEDADNMYPYDLEKAQALLEEAGWVDSDGDGIREKDGQKLTIEYPALPDWEGLFMELLTYSLQDAGFEVNLVTMDDAGITEVGAAGGHNILNMGWVSRDPSVLSYMFLSSNIEGGSAYTRFRNDRLDECLTLAPQTVDPEARKALYQEAQQIIMDNALVIPIHVYANLYVTDAAVEGFSFDGEGYPYLYDIYLAAK